MGLKEDGHGGMLMKSLGCSRGDPPPRPQAVRTKVKAD